MTFDELSNRLINYTKTYFPDEFNDCYKTPEDAFEEFAKIIEKLPLDIEKELLSDINMLVRKKDLTNKKYLRQFNEAVALARDINICNFSKIQDKENEI